MRLAGALVDWIVNRVAGPRLFLIATPILVIGAFLYGHNLAREACAAARLQAEIETLKADLDIARRQEGLARSQAERLAAETRILEKKVTDYELALKKRPDQRCLLTRDDVRRLR